MGNVISKKYTRLRATKVKDTTLMLSPQVSSAALDAKIESVTNESFGTASNLIKYIEPVVSSIDSESGDGWITKRHQSDASVTIKLCGIAHILGLDIDTTGFNEMCPTHALVEGYQVTDKDTNGMWTTLIDYEQLTEDGHNIFQIHDEENYSHVRLTVCPGGGIARFRVYGEISPDWPDLSQQYNLSSANDGARIVHWSDLESRNKPNVLLDNGALTTQGWLTPRSKRTPRNDFIVIKLSSPGNLNSIQVDTTGFKGNSPLMIQADGCNSKETNPCNSKNTRWSLLIPESPITDNCVNSFQVSEVTTVTHVRLTVIPDGGIQQIKCIGFPQQNYSKKETPRKVNTSVHDTHYSQPTASQSGIPHEMPLTSPTAEEFISITDPDLYEESIIEELNGSTTQLLIPANASNTHDHITAEHKEELEVNEAPLVEQLNMTQMHFTPPTAENLIPITDPDLYEKTIIEELNGSTTQLLIPANASTDHDHITVEDKRELEASEKPLVEQLNMAQLPIAPVSVQSSQNTVHPHSTGNSYNTEGFQTIVSEQTIIEETTTIIEEIVEPEAMDIEPEIHALKRKSSTTRSEPSATKKRAVSSRAVSPRAASLRSASRGTTPRATTPTATTPRATTPDSPKTKSKRDNLGLVTPPPGPELSRARSAVWNEADALPPARKTRRSRKK
ncbi:galactose-binding domain-like protein [Mucor mucedo]|uniref:galactose-binding domain-like protein n=1 Tax=Mucor mucedo TaxID=29922 RepID=UPI0022205C23|nr:galactose-binding domain-like protein [Mucor mucedo]KAI7891074.1 galactose-binding domain-like protein [Mucor mucedo]